MVNKKALMNIKGHQAPDVKLPVEYIIKSSIEVVDSKSILFLSFFSQKKIKNKADFKVFISNDRYITQKLQDDGNYKWSESCIENLIGYWWYGSLKAGCITSEETKLIESFLKIKCKPGNEYEAIDQYQKNIMSQKLKEKHDKIRKRIDGVMAKVPELPKDFEKWVYNGPFDFSRYIYYKREGRKIAAYCTECKNDFALKETDETKRKIHHNNQGICPICNKKITYKALGKSTKVEDSAKFAIVQKYEGGLIVRYFHGVKSYYEHFKHPSLMYWENIREIYLFEKGKLILKRFEHANFCQTGEYRWCDDSGKIETPKAYCYTRNLKTVMKDTKWKYSCMYDYVKEVKVLYADTFLKEYIKTPAIEYFIKLKLYRFVNDKLSISYHPDWEGINFKGKNIKDILGIDKSLFIQMQRLNLGHTGLELLKKVAEIGKSLNDKEIIWVLNNTSIYNFTLMLECTTPHQIIKYTQKQANGNYTPEHVMTDWCDYIKQCKTLNLNIRDTFVLYPKNLREKHEEYAILTQAKGLEKYNDKIIKAYERVNKLYTYFDAKFSIRPAKDVYEIVKEGRMQRHCVGGVNYVSGVADNKISIMLLRKNDDTDTPFYTLELDLKTLDIRQCRGYRNCSTTDEVNKFLNKWKKDVLNKKKKKEKVKIPA